MKEFVELLKELKLDAEALWNCTEPQRQWVRAHWAGFERRARAIASQVQWIMRFAIVWLFVLVVAAMFCPPRIATTGIPILTLLPLALLAWLLTAWTQLAALTVIAVIPANAPFEVGKIAAFLKTAIRKLAIVLLIELLLGTYLSAVPVSNDSGLVPLLVLVAISLALTSILIGKGWIRKLLILLIVGITLIFILGGRSQAAGSIADQWSKFTSFSAAPAVGNYNPNAICPSMPAAQQPAGGDADELSANLNNPLNIKFSGFVAERGGKDGGIEAKDGGTFAEFDSPEEGLRVGRELLQSEAYRDLDYNQALKKWSNNGYGGEIVAGSGLAAGHKIGELSPAELDQLIALMQQHEGGSPTGIRAAIAARSRNDHSFERISQFDVQLHDGCFADWVRVPRFWRTWEKEFVSPEPDHHVGFWYFGWPRSAGPYGPNNIPEINYPPAVGNGDVQAKWRLQGKGIFRYIQTS